LVLTKVGDAVFRPSESGIYYATISNAIAMDASLNSNTLQARSAQAKICAHSGIAVIKSNISGATYQWQVSTDSLNYTIINDGVNYTGT
jgi:hypothetical protein